MLEQKQRVKITPYEKDLVRYWHILGGLTYDAIAARFDIPRHRVARIALKSQIVNQQWHRKSKMSSEPIGKTSV